MYYNVNIDLVRNLFVKRSGYMADLSAINNLYLSPITAGYTSFGIQSAGNSTSTENTDGAGEVNPSECQTCANRKYQDGSDEMVSFKAPGKISPEKSYGKVLGHEKEHVANAIAEGSKENKELVSATVSLRTSICPECGRSYVSGGTTTTIMKTYKDDAFSQNKKSFEQGILSGNNFDSKI